MVGKDGKFTIHEETSDDQPQDDGNDQNQQSYLREIDVAFEQAAGQLTINTPQKGWTITFLGLRTMPENLSLTVDGSKRELEYEPIISDDAHSGLTVFVPALEGGDAFEIVLDIGADPQLTPMDPAPRVETLLLDAQMDNSMKDKIWASVSSNRPVGVKVGQLMSLGLDEELVGPILELLVADSRSGA